MSKKTTDLIVLDNLNAAIAVTKTDLEKGFQKIKKDTKGIVPVLDTPKGRKEYTTLAHSISKEKVATLKPLKILIKGIKGAIKPLSDLNRLYEKEFDDYRIEFRKPLTDWETEDARKKAEDKKRIGHIQERLKAIQEYVPRDQNTNIPIPISKANVDELLRAIGHLQTCAFDGSSGFEEFLEEAIGSRDSRVKELQEILNLRKSEEKLAADQKLLKDAQDKLDKDKTNQKAEKDRVEKVRLKGLEDKMQAIRDCEFTEYYCGNAPKIKESIDRLRLIIVDEFFQEFEEKAQAEKNRILTYLGKKLPLAEKADKETSEKEEAQIVEKERLRVAKIAEDKKAVDDKRKADLDHIKKIHRGLVSMFKKYEYSEEQAVKILSVVFNEKNPHLTINY